MRQATSSATNTKVDDTPVFIDGKPWMVDDKKLVDGKVVKFRRQGTGRDMYPDLTVFGKIVAGGYPSAGGVGGKKEYVSLMAAGLAGMGKKAYVGGTLAANPLSSYAGYVAICEIEKNNACEVAGKAGDRLAAGLKALVKKYNLPYVVYNQGSIVHLECTGAMSYDFSNMSLLGSIIPMLKKKPEMLRRKVAMEQMAQPTWQTVSLRSPVAACTPLWQIRTKSSTKHSVALKTCSKPS